MAEPPPAMAEPPPPGRRLRPRFWAIGATLLIILVATVVLILTRGNTLVPGPTATPPLEFTVTAVTLGGSPIPIASSAACPLIGNVAVGESQVSGQLTLNEGTAVTSVTIQVLTKRSLSTSAYQGCVGAIPGFAGNPDNSQIIQLPRAGAVAVPGLDQGGDINLIVRPPSGLATGAIAYTWQITVDYTSGYGPGSDPQGPFILLAPPSRP